MIFNSYVFLLLLIVTLIVYYTFLHFHQSNLAKGSLIVASILFYGYFDYRYLIVLFLSIVWNYVCGQGLWKKNSRALLTIGIAGNVLLLFCFKYMNFFITNVNMVFHKDIALLKWILPLGISFFTFQQIAYLIDAYRKKVERFALSDFVLSSIYFPKITQGPIMYHQDFIAQLHDAKRRQLSYEELCLGLYMFTLGLAKKVLLADVFAQFVDYGYTHDLNSTTAILVMLAYTMQIYFDFSGYSDMARGISRMFRLDLPMNFNSPYKAMNIQDFWARWHMSLTHFLTHYLYIPLGGNRKGEGRTYVNVFLVFLISGIWHGADWTFVIWGMMHGIGSIIHKKYAAFFAKLHPAFVWMLTFAFVNVAWVFFRASDVMEALHMLKTIAACNFGTVPLEMLKTLLLPELAFLLQLLPFAALLRIVPYVILLGSILTCLICRNSDEKCQTYRVGTKKMFVVGILLFWCLISFSNVTTFIYFNF